MPFSMLRALGKFGLKRNDWDGIIWYSPTIFWGPVVRHLKRANQCKSYLILRDIFPEWAVDTGLMKKRMAWLFFKLVATFQYAQADTIGIQTPGNQVYFDTWANNKRRQLQLLENWLAPICRNEVPAEIDLLRVAYIR